MNVVEIINGMLAKRGALVEELAAIDRELADVRRALGITASVLIDEPTSEPIEIPPAVGPRAETACEKCGKRFVPGPGVSGRWCSFECYRPAGLPVVERRDLILRMVEAHGPIFTSGLIELAPLKDISRATLYNDLCVLRRDGKVDYSDDGWCVAGQREAETTEEPGVDSGVPFPQTTNIHPSQQSKSN